VETICLIAPAVSTDFEDADEATSRQVSEAVRTPKVGVLALAGVLERLGAPPRLFDLDDAYEQYRAAGDYADLEGFPAWVAPRIVSCGARVFGFSTVCSSYPLTVRIAECVRREAPGVTIVFGGPQASAVDMATLTAFPFVDCILRGEADYTLPAFLDEWSGERQFSKVLGLTWRTPFGPQRNPDAPVIADLDDLPLPPYHLAGDLKGADSAYLELGRGCPFSCTFCSTNDFFRRKFRLKSPARMLADMRAIADRYAIRDFELVHDMFTVDRRKVAEFCEAMIASGEGFRWACSARTDFVDEELLELMARAGCNGVFFGVEAGSMRMQRIIDKDLDTTHSRRVVEIADRLGISTTVSVIMGFPEENEADLRETLDVYAHALRHPMAHPQMNILAPLAGTPIHRQYKDEMVLEELCSHLAYQGRKRNAADHALVREFPDIFPNFYLLPTDSLERAAMIELREFLLMASTRLRWLLAALHRCAGGILDLYLAWRTQRLALHPDVSGSGLRYYYTLDTARDELLAFVRARLADFADPAVEPLLAQQETLARVKKTPRERPAGLPIAGRIAARDVPVRAPDVEVIELGWDIQAVIDSLRRGAAWEGGRSRRQYRTADVAAGECRLIEIMPRIAQALALCDGAHTVERITAQMAASFDCPKELQPYAAGYLLKELRKQGLIEIVRPVDRPRPKSVTARRALQTQAG
jgi:radical SAM superfamily enzyme YgiQ (UPF0313 family)